MGGIDTSIGGPQKSFPETAWSKITRTRGRGAILESLCSRYWKPVYCYIRIAWSKSNEDAKDLTQAFFTWLIEDDALDRFTPERGSFRSYLKVLLSRFVGHQERALHRLKREGGAAVVRLDEDVDAGVLADPRAGGPEKAFDQQWAMTVGRLALDRVRSRFAETGRELQFRVYSEHDLVAPETRPGYGDLAARLGLTEAQVRHYLSEVRSEIRSAILAELRELTASDEALEEEWRALFGA